MIIPKTAPVTISTNNDITIAGLFSSKIKQISLSFKNNDN